MAVPYDCFDYPSYWIGRKYEHGCEKIALQSFLKKIGNVHDLVDIGGGFGRLAEVYTHCAERCEVLEPSDKLRKIGQEKNLSQNLFFKRGSLPKLPFKDETFDIALLIRVIHHLDDPSLSFLEINRILKKGGFFILEMANKTHFLACLKALLKLDFGFARDWAAIERRSRESILAQKITFINHHPQKIISDLVDSNFKVREVLSVSNFRYGLVKKMIPLLCLLSLEKKLQRPLAKFFFAPSIFILAEKI